MAQVTAGDIVYTVSMDSSKFLESSKRTKTEILKLGESGEKSSKGIEQLEKKAATAAPALSKLTTIAKGLSAAIVGSQIISYAQGWRELKDRIGNTGATAEETKAILESLIKTSNRNGRTIEESAELYIRLSNAMKEMGYSTDSTLTYIDSLSNLFTINQTDTMKSEAAIRALTNAQIKGKLAGIDAISVFSAIPSVLQTLSKELSKTGEKLKEADVRQMAIDGKISVEMLTQALIKADPEVAKLADNMQNKLGDATNHVSNNLKKYLGEMDDAVGGTKLLVDSVNFLAEHANVLATTFGVVGAIIAGKYVTSLASSTKATIAKSYASAMNATNTMRESREIIKKTEVAGRELTAEIANITAQKAAAKTAAERLILDKQLNTLRAQRKVLIDQETAAEARLAVAQKSAITLANGLRGALSLLGGPAGLLFLVAGGIATLATSASNAAPPMRDYVKSIDEITASLSKLNNIQLKGKVAELSEEAKEHQSEIDELTGKIRQYKYALDIINDPSKWGDGQNLNMVKTFGTVEELINKIAQAEGQLDRKQALLANTITESNATIVQMTENLKNLGVTTNTAASELNNATKTGIEDKIKDLGNEIEITNMKINGQAKQAYILQGALEALGDGGDKYKEALIQMINGTIDFSKVSADVIKVLQPLLDVLGKNYDANKRLGEINKKGKGSTKSYADELKELKNKLEVAKLEAKGLTVEAELLSTTQKMGSKATAAQTEELKKLIAQTQAYKDIETFKSPLEKENADYTKTSTSLKNLFEMGLYTQDEYNKKSKELAEKHQAELAKINSEATVSTKDTAIAQVDPVQALENENAKKLALIKEFEEQKWITEQNAIALREAANYQYEQNRINAQWEIWKNQSDMNNFLASSLEGLASSATSTIAGLASGTMNATEAMQNFANVILNEAVGSLVQMGMQWLKNSILAQTASTSTAAIQSAQGVALTAIYEPLAMYMSIATQGAAAVTGAAGFASAIGAMKGASIAGAREHGGSVNQGSAYRVGEGGKPEILMQGGKQYLIPSENGDVLSNRQITSGGSGNSLSINMPISIGGDSGISQSDASRFTDTMVATVKTVISSEKRYGGTLEKLGS